ncbi:glycosyltransferase [Photorhabdus noenieputensis]|uniref:glycosyltransferase n=1 Tax=Photorhabdus noenieputensis TaxID=1208607 RepID=UPI001BD1DC1D|nr:glycosyltransferase [Photorhabdus noenieputensis]MBS9436685.1 glycosyltransferase [Photorhabdus noenieputensis]MCK3669461.1 glycosyltransferase [Photorhabdus noenieputensis]
MNFSVLMSLYDKESPSYLDQCLESLFNQKLKSNEIVLIFDGKINLELEKTVSNWMDLLPIKIIRLEENVGLASALNIGLEFCNNELIARMDTDDICEYDRFFQQVKYLKKNPNTDIVGMWISEIDENNNIIKGLVKYPLEHKDLLSFFSKRAPLAHPSVMFRKSFFNKAGIYPTNILLEEDTALWYNGFLNNCIFANIPYIGLKFRRTSNFYKRRSNLRKTIDLLKFRLIVINRKLGYGLKGDIYAVLYFFISLSPSFMKKVLYKYLR